MHACHMHGLLVPAITATDVRSATTRICMSLHTHIPYIYTRMYSTDDRRSGAKGHTYIVSMLEPLCHPFTLCTYVSYIPTKSDRRC